MVVEGRCVRITCIGYERKECVYGGRGLRNSILPTLMHGSQIWTWNRAQNSRVPAVEISYLREACSVNKWECESNKSVYQRCGTATHADGVKCL